MQTLVEGIEGQVKSATEEGHCKPAGQSRLEKLKCSGLSEVKLKYSGRRKDVTWSSKLECEVNRSLVGFGCILCW